MPPMPSVRAFTDSSYGPHMRQRYDLFVPDDADQCPTVICVPGGWWTTGDFHEMRGLSLRLAELGWASAAIGFRLLEKDVRSGQEMVDDVKAATTKAVEEAAISGADSRAVVILGSGSGSLIALAAAAQLLGDRACRLRVQAVVACGLTPSARPWEGCPVTLAPTVKNFGGATPDSIDPAAMPAEAFPPLLLLHGEADHDVPTRLALDFQKRQQEAGELCRLETVPSAGHQFVEGAFDRAGRFAVDRIAAFLKELAPARQESEPPAVHR